MDTTDQIDTMAAVAELIVAEFADEQDDDRPVYVSRAIIIADVTTATGGRALCLWSPESIPDWERIGMLRAQIAELEGRYADL